MAYNNNQEMFGMYKLYPVSKLRECASTYNELLKQFSFLHRAQLAEEGYPKGCAKGKEFLEELFIQD